METLCSIILAAGEGTRMKSCRPKVLAEVLFKPMIQHVLDSITKAGIKDTCVITGYQHSILEAYLKENDPNVKTVRQIQRLGTAHAVSMAIDFLKKHLHADVFIIGGDTPFIDDDTIRKSYEHHISSQNSATVISAEVENPFGYGRIVRNPNNKVNAIVEQKDATDSIQKIKEINSGAYWFKVEDLIKALPKIKPENAQNEYYLPDAIKVFINEGNIVDAYKTTNSDVILGANDCLQLNALNEIARQKVLRNLMLSGVNIPCTDGVIISNDATFGQDVCIMPGTIIRGNAAIKSNTTLGPNVII